MNLSSSDVCDESRLCARVTVSFLDREASAKVSELAALGKKYGRTTDTYLYHRAAFGS